MDPQLLPTNVNYSDKLGDSSERMQSPPPQKRDNSIFDEPEEAKGCCKRTGLFVGYAA